MMLSYLSHGENIEFDESFEEINENYVLIRTHKRLYHVNSLFENFFICSNISRYRK